MLRGIVIHAIRFALAVIEATGIVTAWKTRTPGKVVKTRGVEENGVKISRGGIASTSQIGPRDLRLFRKEGPARARRRLSSRCGVVLHTIAIKAWFPMLFSCGTAESYCFIPSWSHPGPCKHKYSLPTDADRIVHVDDQSCSHAVCF